MPDAQFLDPFGQLGNQGVGGLLSHGNRNGNCHAAFAGGTVPGADQGVGSHVQIGVGHDHHVVLRTAKALGTLSVRGGGGVDVLGDRRRTHKADGLDPGIFQECVHGFLVAVDDVEDAIGYARLAV